jgi:hypothetical protein
MSTIVKKQVMKTINYISCFKNLKSRSKLKLTIAIMVCCLINMNANAQAPALKTPSFKVNIIIRSLKSGCDHGLGLCAKISLEKGEGSTPVLLQPSENGIELLFNESELDETIIAEIRDGNRFQVGPDVELSDELAERLGIMGNRSLQGGFYPMQYRPPYYAVTCPLR